MSCNINVSEPTATPAAICSNIQLLCVSVSCFCCFFSYLIALLKKKVPCCVLTAHNNIVELDIHLETLIICNYLFQ